MLSLQYTVGVWVATLIRVPVVGDSGKSAGLLTVVNVSPVTPAVKLSAYATNTLDPSIATEPATTALDQPIGTSSSVASRLMKVAARV